MISQVLKECKILVCRPEPSATELAKALTSVGAKVETLPCVEIKAIELSGEARQRILNLDSYDHIIVLSQHAAQLAVGAIDEYWPQLPVNQQWHAIGRKTAQTLEAVDIDLVDPIRDLSSEELLNTEQLMHVKGKSVLILRGLNGRNTLNIALRNRGAKVDTIELYERCKPSYDDNTLKEKLKQFAPDYLVALSGETLQNLLQFADTANVNLSQSTFILPSARVADIAIEYGFNLTYVPNNLMPIDIIRGIASLQRSKV